MNATTAHPSQPPHLDRSPASGSLPIADVAEGERLLSALPLASPAVAHREIDGLLDALLDGLTAGALDAGDVLDLLEEARTPFCFIAEERARHYSNKALPLAAADDDVFAGVTRTCEKIARVYSGCAVAGTDGNQPRNRVRTALALHRALYYEAMRLTEHFRARREWPADAWRRMHDIYATAERLSVDTVPVPDPLDPVIRSSNVASALIGALLLELAGPYSLSIREQNLIRRWAAHWAALANISPLNAGEPLPACILDLARAAPLRAAESSDSAAEGAESLRGVDTLPLIARLNAIRERLNQHAAPSDVGLGEDCTAGECRRLLGYVVHAWQKVPLPRHFRRRAAAGSASVCSGFEAMHYFVSGKEFAPPTNEVLQSHRSFEQLYTFPQMVDPARPLVVQEDSLGLSCVRWDVVDQSANGLRLRRPAERRDAAREDHGTVHGQLVGVSQDGSRTFMLGRVNWLMQDEQGQVVVGLELLPGAPQAIAVKPLTHTEVHDEPYGRGFLLPAIPMIGVAASLVLPLGSFHPARVVEVAASAPHRVKLLHVLEEGFDFERISFAEAP